MEQVTSLKPRERIAQDGEAIAMLYRNLGHATAERLVNRAFSELLQTLGRAAARVESRMAGDLPGILVELQTQSANLGMTSFHQVACDAQSCLERGDDTAFTAVWARLLRITERSLLVRFGDADRRN